MKTNFKGLAVIGIWASVAAISIFSHSVPDDLLPYAFYATLFVGFLF
jgi:hypothetical protein